MGVSGWNSWLSPVSVMKRGRVCKGHTHIYTHMHTWGPTDMCVSQRHKHVHMHAHSHTGEHRHTGLHPTM